MVYDLLGNGCYDFRLSHMDSLIDGERIDYSYALSEISIILAKSREPYFQRTVYAYLEAFWSQPSECYLAP